MYGKKNVTTRIRDSYANVIMNRLLEVTQVL